MKTFTLDIGNIQRRYNAVYPISRIGFLFTHSAQEERTFKGKLELCLRISSESEYAEDTLNGTKLRTSYPHVILKSPDVLHSYTVEAPRDAVYITYDPSLAPELEAAGLLTTPYCWPVVITPEINAVILKMRELVDNIMEDYVIDQLDLMGMQFFEYLLAQRKPHKDKSGQMEKTIQQIASYFHLNVTEVIDLDTLLRKKGISRRSFFRYWNTYYDLSPAQYMRELKLQHASTLLAETSMPIWKITDELKFKDSQYFCRIFRNRFGLTPLKYRKQNCIAFTK